MSLPGRAIITDHFIMASLWYLLTLWNGTLKVLQAMQQKVNTFLWGGQWVKARHRVDANTTYLPKAEGGGWAFYALRTKHVHYRPKWCSGLRGRVASLIYFEIFLGSIFAPCHVKGGAPLISLGFLKRFNTPRLLGFSTMCDGWLVAKKNLKRCKPATVEDWRTLPLWSPHIHHDQPARVNCTTLGQKELRHQGLLTLRSITNQAGQVHPWSLVPTSPLPPSTELAYNALIANI
jgi:hypothetical protein